MLLTGTFDTAKVDEVLDALKETGSKAAPGFMNPEGVVVFHAASQYLFKKTLDKNDGHKGTHQPERLDTKYGDSLANKLNAFIGVKS